MVTVVLRDTMTRGELSLVAHDHADVVLATRATFQEMMGDELRAGVEQVVQRKVIAFMSANHVDPDMAVETLILAPLQDDAPKAALTEA